MPVKTIEILLYYSKITRTIVEAIDYCCSDWF